MKSKHQSRLPPVSSQSSLTFSSSSSSVSTESSSSSSWIPISLSIVLVLAITFIIILSTPRYSNGTLDPHKGLTTKLDLTKANTSYKQLTWDDLSSLVRHKLTIVGRVIKTGKPDLPALDPLQLSSLWLLTNDNDQSLVNASLHQVQVFGLPSMVIKDVATNNLTRGLSILLKFPGITISGSYEMIHRLNHHHHPNTSSSHPLETDSGKFRLKTDNWFTSWFADVASIDIDHDIVLVRRPWLKSYYDNVTREFTSTRYKTCGVSCEATLDTIGTMILDKVKSEIDSQLAKLIGTVIQEEPIDRNHWMTAVNEMNTQIDLGRGRTKRQVPCKPGKELDEYVDSLFRFASRIVRVMEPFALPNATIWLPEYNIKVFLFEGGATRAFTLNRKKSAWVHCSNESVSLGLTVGFENLRIKYRYRAIHDWKLLWDGDFEADLQDTKLQVQFTQTTPKGGDDEKVQQRVDRLRIWRLGKVRVIIRGLGNLTHGVALWLSRFLNDPHTQKSLDPSLRRLEIEAVSMINVMLQNLTVPFFTII